MTLFKLLGTFYLLLLAREKGCNKEYDVSFSKGISVVKNIFFVENGRDTSYFKDTFHVYTYKDYIFYHITYDFDSSVNERMQETEIRNGFFIYKKNAKNGYYFDSKNNSKSKFMSIDSFIKSKSINIPNEFIKPTFINYDKAKDELIEVYVKNIDNNNRNDTMVYYYRKSMSKTEYSFSKILDSSRHSKLYKIELIPGSIGSGKENMGNFKAIFEMKEIIHDIHTARKQFDFFLEVKKRYEKLK